MLAPQLQLALNEDLYSEIAQAVVAAMGNTFGKAVQVGAFEVGEGSVLLSGDISGIIGLVQDELEGTLTLCMPFSTIKRLLPVVLGDTVEVTQDIALDAIAEITNMIFNQVKTNLNGRGYQIRLGIPTTVAAKGHFLSHFHRGRYMIVPFSIDGVPFQVHLAIHNTYRAS